MGRLEGELVEAAGGAPDTRDDDRQVERLVRQGRDRARHGRGLHPAGCGGCGRVPGHIDLDLLGQLAARVPLVGEEGTHPLHPDPDLRVVPRGWRRGFQLEDEWPAGRRRHVDFDRAVTSRPVGDLERADEGDPQLNGRDTCRQVGDRQHPADHAGHRIRADGDAHREWLRQPDNGRCLHPAVAGEAAGRNGGGRFRTDDRRRTRRRRRRRGRCGRTGTGRRPVGRGATAATGRLRVVARIVTEPDDHRSDGQHPGGPCRVIDLRQVRDRDPIERVEDDHRAQSILRSGRCQQRLQPGGLEAVPGVAVDLSPVDEGGGDLAAVGESAPRALDGHTALQPDNVDPIHGALFRRRRRSPTDRWSMLPTRPARPRVPRRRPAHRPGTRAPRYPTGTGDPGNVQAERARSSVG